MSYIRLENPSTNLALSTLTSQDRLFLASGSLGPLGHPLPSIIIDPLDELATDEKEEIERNDGAWVWNPNTANWIWKNKDELLSTIAQWWNFFKAVRSGQSVPTKPKPDYIPTSTKVESYMPVLVIGGALIALSILNKK
tara:strand:+ start:31 stop:447 length:417 start_codon:yes stop_codon:yes gene_type:complete